LFLIGLNELFKVTTTTIDKRQISFSFRSLLRSKQWVEDFENYKGILYRDAHPSGGKNKPSSTLYTVELFHNDREKVVLYQSTYSKGMRRIWEDSCRKLNLQALEIDGSSLVKRNIEDLDKSIRDLVKEGKRSIDFEPSRPPPKGLKAKLAGNAFQITLTKGNLTIVGGVLALIVPSIFIVIGFSEDKGLPMGIFGIVFALVEVNALIGEMFWRSRISVGEDTIHLSRVAPWGETPGTTIIISEIESIIVERKDNHFHAQVFIKTDQQQEAIGGGLSPESLEWLKNCIVSIIST